jgi:hypothetical protein
MATGPKVDGLLLPGEVPQDLLDSAKALFCTWQPQFVSHERGDRHRVAGPVRGSEGPARNGHLRLTA